MTGILLLLNTQLYTIPSLSGGMKKSVDVRPGVGRRPPGFEPMTLYPGYTNMHVAVPSEDAAFSFCDDCSLLPHL